jgi:lipopolysaccharide biosynthesis regulator YciM
MKAEREQQLRTAVETFNKVLQIDSENVTAHYNLEILHRSLGQTEQAELHGKLHRRYKEDDAIRGVVIRKAREKYPAADHAAEALVIYPLRHQLQLPSTTSAVPAQAEQAGAGGED